ncbi:SHD1 domain-containing protein [Novipirellula caenicola]|uniref:SLA1 homology domain-containing protein n=1 Tax=Novipirellula caenicola TaxID=1536901 RepID=A0ABP9VUX7_9BACT
MSQTNPERCSASSLSRRMSLRQYVWIPIFLASLVMATPTTASEPVRIWVDQSGLHAIEAMLISITDEVAFLRRPDGSKVKIAVDQLSQADQDYISSWSDRSHFSENHLRWTPPVLPRFSARPLLDLPAATSLLNDGDALAAVRGSLAPLKTTLPSVCVPDPQPFSYNLAFGKQTIGDIQPYDSVSRPLVIATESQTFLAASISTGLNSNQSATSNRIVCYEPATGKASTVFQSKVPVTILDHHQPSGRTLVLYGHRVMGHGGQLAVAKGWEDDQLSIKYFRSLPMISSSTSAVGTQGKQVHWARWIDDEHVVAAIDTEIAVWNLFSGECVHRICRIPSACEPAISTGRRYIAVPRPGVVELYETESGASLGTIPIEPGQRSYVSFSPRGDSLAIATTSRLRVWELSSASLRGEATSRRSLGKGAPVWIDTDLVLSSNGVLLSIYRGVPVWRYELSGSTIASFGFTTEQQGVGLVTRRPHGQIAYVEVPHETVQRAVPWVNDRLASDADNVWDIPGKSVLGEYGWTDRELRFTQFEQASR